MRVRVSIRISLDHKGPHFPWGYASTRSDGGDPKRRRRSMAHGVFVQLMVTISASWLAQVLMLNKYRMACGVTNGHRQPSRYGPHRHLRLQSRKSVLGGVFGLGITLHARMFCTTGGPSRGLPLHRSQIQTANIRSAVWFVRPGVA